MQPRVDPASKPGVDGTEEAYLLTISMHLNAMWCQLLETGSAQSYGPFGNVLFFFFSAVIPVLPMIYCIVYIFFFWKKT